MISHFCRFLSLKISKPRHSQVDAKLVAEAQMRLGKAVEKFLEIGETWRWMGEL